MVVAHEDPTGDTGAGDLTALKDSKSSAAQAGVTSLDNTSALL